MTTAQSSTTEWLSKRQRYRKLLFGSILAGVALSLLLRGLDYPVIGEAVYWLGIVAFVGIWRGADIQLVDERDAELERRASLTALQSIGAVLVVGASTARLLPRLTDYTVPTMVAGALYGYIGLFVVFGVAYFWHRTRL